MATRVERYFGYTKGGVTYTAEQIKAGYKAKSAALDIAHKQQRQLQLLRHMQEQRELGGYAE